MPQSPELAGGAGFTFEDRVAATYLAALLGEGFAPGIADLRVSRVAQQQRDFGEPLDDVVVDFGSAGGHEARLSLQADADDPVLTSVGRPLPYALVEIRDLEEPRRRLPPGARGEVALRCGAAMPGFLDEPDGGGERVVDGWVLTGDIGEMDEAGFLRLVDRKSQTIVSGGFNIYPAEIEAALLALDGVIEAIVFGVPDERFGERPHAVCRVSDAVAISESEVIEHCAKSLGSFRKPARVELWKDPLPRTPVGKLDRASLRDRHWDRGGVYVNAV